MQRKCADPKTFKNPLAAQFETWSALEGETTMEKMKSWYTSFTAGAASVVASSSNMQMGIGAYFLANPDDMFHYNKNIYEQCLTTEITVDNLDTQAEEMCDYMYRDDICDGWDTPRNACYNGCSMHEGGCKSMCFINYYCHTACTNTKNMCNGGCSAYDNAKNWCQSQISTQRAMCRGWCASALACDPHRQAWLEQRSNKTRSCIIQSIWTTGTAPRQCR